jgi:hypothetical protein
MRLRYVDLHSFSLNSLWYICATWHQQGEKMFKESQRNRTRVHPAQKFLISCDIFSDKYSIRMLPGSCLDELFLLWVWYNSAFFLPGFAYISVVSNTWDKHCFWLLAWLHHYSFHSCGVTQFPGPWQWYGISYAQFAPQLSLFGVIVTVLCGVVTVHFSFTYEGVSKSFQTELIMKYMLTFGITHWEATQRVMVAKLSRLTHKIAVQLHLVADSCTICSSCSRQPVQELLDIPSYMNSCSVFISVHNCNA